MSYNYVTYINKSGRRVLEYNTDGSYVLNLPFILTRSKKLTKHKPYMLLEGSRPTAVRLLDVRHSDGMVYLEVQELETNRTFTLTWNMDYEGSYWLWTLADYDTLMNLAK